MTTPSFIETGINNQKTLASANEEAAFRSATILKTSFGYIETGPWLKEEELCEL